MHIAAAGHGRPTPCGASLLSFVDKRSFVGWPSWIPPRVGNNSSVVAQFQRLLSERVAITLSQNDKHTFSGPSDRVSHPRYRVGPIHRRVGSIERCINVVAR